jgi:hypothetical protein
MGQNYYGVFARPRKQRSVDYAGNYVWGTGINRIHAYRQPTGRPQNYNEPLSDLDKRTLAHMTGEPGFIETGPPWGYQPEDLAGLDVFANPEVAIQGYYYPPGDGPYPGGDEHPNIDTGIGWTNRATIPDNQSRPWQAGPRQRSWLRSQKWAGSPRGGATTAGGQPTYQNSNEIPTETVSEGWINKGSTGGLIESPEFNSQPAPTHQVFVNTSMVQRHRMLNNDRAVARGQDEPRESIPSRIVGPKVKVYSGEDPDSNRAYDMFPYQAEAIPRPFHYRTFGGGPQNYTKNNEQYERRAIQRTPAPDAGLGIPDTQFSEQTDDGYTADDQGWY